MITSNPHLFLFLLGVTALISPACFAFDEIITLHNGDLIVAEGDSVTYGKDPTVTGRAGRTLLNGTATARSITPYPETLQNLLHDQVTVENRGYPGDRTVEGLGRWTNKKDGALALIMYGTNDCWNFGGYPNGKISVGEFTGALKGIAARRLRGGAKVILLLPPPLQDPEKEAAMVPYRDAVKQIAKELDVMVEDVPDDLGSAPSIWVDGIHLSPAANRKIAAALAEHIHVE